MRPLTVTAAALLALAAGAPAAHAAQEIPTPQRGLFLTVSGSDNTWIRGVLLHCEPEPSGHHPQAAKACEALAEAGGDLDALPEDPHACTKEFDPVTVSVTGTYQGRTIGWHKTYPNACTMDADTGYVFRF
ncbi:SSI family serine proteinase inhibitor [Streptomyces luteocolor]|uniref:SSI family serine proteinase inhibitor n=1 Tax=Streptomyces luteocolor TaxID=285500 RepID=UPI000853051C|nr:SSI family serine proteinase inhibitor [Streptomyces luteocolor]